MIATLATLAAVAIPAECGDALAVQDMMHREGMAPVFTSHDSATRLTIYSADLFRDAYWIAVVQRRETPGVACVVAEGSNFEFGGASE